MNLSGANVMLVDSDRYTRGIVAQMLRGFGVPAPSMVESGAAAQNILKHGPVDLLICEAVLPDMPSSGLIRWVRRLDSSHIRFVPIIVMTGYTQARVVAQARDSGANIVVKKPVAPQVLYDHIGWVARIKRPFIETDDYIGPDRRFKNVPRAFGAGRRENDLDLESANSVASPQGTQLAGKSAAP